MKLDIQKAYDMVDWRFLCKTLEAFGFARQWINLIIKRILTTKILVLINGTPFKKKEVMIFSGEISNSI